MTGQLPPVDQDRAQLRAEEARVRAGAGGANSPDALVDAVLRYLPREHPESRGEWVIRQLNKPLELVTQVLAKTMAPEHVAARYHLLEFAPDLARQRTMFQLRRDLAGVPDEPGFSLPDLIGVGLDVALDPLMWVRLGAPKALWGALAEARRVGGSAEAVAQLIQNVRRGEDAIQLTAEGLARMDPKQVARIRAVNQVLRSEARAMKPQDLARLFGTEPEVQAGTLAEHVRRTLAGAEAGRVPEAGRVAGAAAGQRHLLEFAGLHLPGEQQVAKGMQVAAAGAGRAMRSLPGYDAVAGKLRELFTAGPLLPVVRKVFQDTMGALPADSDKVWNASLENLARSGDMTADQVKEVMRKAAKPLLEDQSTVTSAQEVMARLDSDAFEQQWKDIQARTSGAVKSRAPQVRSEEVDAWLRPKRVGGDQVRGLEATLPRQDEPVAQVVQGGARWHVVRPADPDEAARVRGAVRDLADVPGFGNWGVGKDGRAWTKSTAPLSDPERFSYAHAENLERSLALAAQRGWGARELNLDQLALGPHGQVQLVDPRPMAPFGADKVGQEAAAESSRRAVAAMLDRVSPGAAQGSRTLEAGRFRRVDASQVVPHRMDVAEADVLRGAAGERYQASVEMLRGAANYDGLRTPGADALAARFRSTGRVTPVEVKWTPEGVPWIATDDSLESLRAMEQLGMTEIPVVVTGWTGDDWGKVPRAFRDEQALEQARKLAAGKHPTPVWRDAAELLPNPMELKHADDARVLRELGLSEQELAALQNRVAVDIDGNVVASPRIAAERARAATQDLRDQVRHAVIDVMGWKHERDAQVLVDSAFPALRQGGVAVDLPALEAIAKTLSRAKQGSKAAFRAEEVAAGLRTELERVKQYLATGDPAAFGHQGPWWEVHPTKGAIAVVSPVDDPAAQSMGGIAAARWAGPHGVDPKTQVVTGSGRARLGDLMKEGGVLQTPAAVETFERASITQRLLEGRSRAPDPAFLADPAHEAALKEKGILLRPRAGDFPDRIPDTEVVGVMASRGGHVMLAKGPVARDSRVMAGEIFQALPQAYRETGYATQGRVRLFNLMFAPQGEVLTDDLAALMTKRLKHLTQQLVDAGAPRSWVLDLEGAVPIDAAFRERVFGKDLTLGQVLDRGWKAEVPAELRGRPIDRVELTTGFRVTENQGSTPAVQEMINWYRNRMQGLTDDEIKAGIMAPEHLIHGYFARYMTPEGRAAVDAFAEAVFKQGGGKEGTGTGLEAWRARHMRGRAFSDLSEEEVNEAFRLLAEGGWDQRKFLKVKLDVPWGKGLTLQEAMARSPGDFAYFIEDFRQSALLRELAGRRSIARKAFVDGVVDATGLAIGPNGERTLPLGEFRRILRSPATPAEEAASQALRHLQESGTYSMVMGAEEARRMLKQGVLDRSYLDRLGESWLVPVDGRLYESADAAGARVSFVRKDVVDDVKRAFSIVEDPVAAGKLLRSFDTVQGLWKAWTLFTVPKFYVRNWLSNVVMLWMTGTHPIRDAGSYKDGASAWFGYKAWRPASAEELAQGSAKWLPRERAAWDRWRTEASHERFAGGINPNDWVTNAAGERKQWGDLVEEANQRGVFRGTWFREFAPQASVLQDFRREAARRGVRLLGEDDTNFFKHNWVLENGKKLHVGSENLFSFISFADQWRKGATVEEAAATARKAMGSDVELSRFERQVMGRAIPFYRWTKYSLPRSVEWLATRPEQAYQALRVTEALMRGEAKVPPEEIPDWIKSSTGLILGRNADGSYSWLTLEGAVPFTDLMRLASFRGDVSDLGLLGISPFVRLGVEASTNRRLFATRGSDVESYPGEPSQAIQGGWATKRMTNQGPAGWGNLLLNDQVLNMARPLREWSNVLAPLALTQKAPSERDRWLGFLFSRVQDWSPERALFHANWDAKGQFQMMRAALRKAAQDGDAGRQEAILGQMSRLEVLQEGR